MPTVFWRLALPGALALCAALMLAPARAATSFRIDPARTHIRFAINAIGWPTTRGEFGNFEGRMAIDFGRPAASRVQFTVKAASVDVGSPGLDDYIRSEVFFDVARFPEMSFVSTSVEKSSDSTAHVAGNLTLLGVTKPIAFDVTVERLGQGRQARLGFRAEIVIHRSEFGMNAGIPLVDDAVRIEVATQAQEG